MERTEAYDEILDHLIDDDENEKEEVIISENSSGRKSSSSPKRATVMKQELKLTQDEKNCQLQQQMLNQLVIKICSQRVSQQHAREIGEAERKLL